VADPAYFHKVVDCQWACPAHTPVPEYIRLIAQGRYDDAYMVNWESNVFPGILGRTCDRPCEPACRRGRVEDKNTAKPEAVAICRLKRVAADFKDGEIRAMLPRAAPKNGKRVVCVGAGPASLTVARDLVLQGYSVTLLDGDAKAGGFMPGGGSLHNQMSGHGPDRASYDAAVAADLRPQRIDETMAFMFESRCVIRPTRFATETPLAQSDYDDCWADFRKADLPQ